MAFPVAVRDAHDRSFLHIALIVLAGLALLTRVSSVAAPLGIDQGLWASAVRGMSQGQLLYLDVWEQRPPGIYLTYLAAFSLFGWVPSVVGWLDVLASTLMTAQLYFLARALAGRTTGALTAALFAVLTMPAWLYRYGGFLERSVCETFIVVCIGSAALCAVGLQRRRTFAMAFGLGFWVGAAVVFKPNAGVYLPALLVWSLFVFPPGERMTARFRVRAVAAAALGGAVLPGLTLLWLWQMGLLAEARTAVVDFNRWYIAEGFSLPTYAQAFFIGNNGIFLRVKQDPLWLAGAVATIVAIWDLVRTRRLPPPVTLAVLWGAAAAVAIVVNGARPFTTYFIQALPPMALLVAWWLADGLSRPGMRRALAVATVVLMSALFVQRNYFPKVVGTAVADANALVGRSDRMTYLLRFGAGTGYSNERGYSARANAELADYVRDHTTVDDRIFLFGINAADVYFLTGRLTAHRFLRVNFYVPDAFPNPQFTLGAVVEDLRARQPTYLIFEQLHSETAMGRAVDALPAHPLIQSLLEGYVPDARIEDFTLYRRR